MTKFLKIYDIFMTNLLIHSYISAILWRFLFGVRRGKILPPVLNKSQPFVYLRSAECNIMIWKEKAACKKQIQRTFHSENQ